MNCKTTVKLSTTANNAAVTDIIETVKVISLMTVKN